MVLYDVGMNRVLTYVVTYTLGLWAGGLVALILFVSTLFTWARAVATDAAPVMFGVFEKYQIGLAVVTLLTLVPWRWAGRSRPKTFALSAVMLATILAFVQISHITPTLNRTRNIDVPKFQSYHSLSTKNYSAIAFLVLISLGCTITAGHGQTKRGERR